jgi:UDP-N-acetylmuramyl pentapeptide phosphotransferase/UDP-N-acetylglucosamine-1-phosphate transferase
MIESLTSSAGMAGAGLLAVLTALASWIATRWVTRYLDRREMLDHPNERSSHSSPTPRGGGLAILAIALPLVGVIHWLHLPGVMIIPVFMGLAAGLALLPWIDDLNGLPVVLRLVAHLLAAAVMMTLMPTNLFVFQGLLPLWLDRAVAVLVWVWFINLYNFMDGIDGLAGAETIAVCIGLFTIVLIVGGPVGPGAVALAQSTLVIAAAAAGFLVLNWHPARVFMGDVGAITLGYVLGWFLLTLATWGYWVAALILPAYFLADASITITRRMLSGEPIWRPHAKHCYQRAVQRGMSHVRVVRFVSGGNCCLMVLAITSTQVTNWWGDMLCLTGAATIVAWMLFWLTRAKPGTNGLA